MNTVVQQFKTGLYMATQSFSMLWYQKKFLVYLGSLALINIAFKLIIDNLSNGVPFFSLFQTMHRHIASLPSWFAPLETLISLCIANILAIFFTVSLLHHIDDSIKDIPTSIRKNFLNSIAKINTIICWAILTSFFEIGMNFLIEQASTSELSIIGYLAITSLIIAWLVLTFFMLPLIAIQNQPLLTLIKSSAHMSKALIIQIIGGECWFGLIILLVATPFLIIWLIAHQPALNPIFPTLGLFSAEIIIKCWIATAHSIFKMMLYQSHTTKIQESPAA